MCHVQLKESTHQHLIHIIRTSYTLHTYDRKEERHDPQHTPYKQHTTLRRHHALSRSVQFPVNHCQIYNPHFSKRC